MVNVTFYGVRGSTPCGGEATAALRRATRPVSPSKSPGEPPIICDLGTGLRNLRCDPARRRHVPRHRPRLPHPLGPHPGAAVLPPILAERVRVRHLRSGADRRLALRGSVRLVHGRPLFPVTVDDLPGSVRFHDANDTRFAVGSAEITARAMPHCGVTNGYRIEWHGVTVAYVARSPAARDDRFELTDAVRELCDGVDLSGARRPVHAHRVRLSVVAGATAPSTSRSGSRARPGRAPGPVPPRSVTRRRRPRRHRCLRPAVERQARRRGHSRRARVSPSRCS